MKRKWKKASIATGILALTVMMLYFEYVNNSTDSEANVYKISKFTTKGARLSLSNILDAKPSVSQPQPPKPLISQPQPPKPPISQLQSPKPSTSQLQLPVNITVFLESFALIDTIPEIRHFFTEFEARYPKACPLPDGGTCTIQHSNSSADVVFRVVRAISNAYPLRYVPGQILAVLNLEANRGAYGIYQRGFRQLEIADIKIDHHPSSDAVYSEMCQYFSMNVWVNQPPPDPKKRKGIAMFSSDCNVDWEGFPERKKYYLELMKFVHIDQYGKCWHNVASPWRKNYRDDWKEAFVKISRKYRMIVAFENIIQKDYISAKLPLIFRAGAIPVYRGPPEAYQWIPGNHSIIDADKYNSPKELADYLKRVSEDDQLFKYHTSNFDLKQARETWNRVCAKADYMCITCKLAHKMKMQRSWNSTQSSKNN